MYIEDLVNILYMSSSPNLNRFDGNMLNSFASQMLSGLAFTEKQSVVILRILKKQKNYLEKITNKNLDLILDNPKWRFPFRTINFSKKMSLDTNSSDPPSVSVEFPYDDNIIKKIHGLKSSGSYIHWNKDKKAWVFLLNEQNLKHLLALSKEYDFKCEEELVNLFNQVEKITENLENYLPMLIWENNEPKLINFPSNLVKIESKTILSAVFEARKYGIFVWDNLIDQYIDSDNLLESTREFLNSLPNEIYNINSEKIPLSNLRQIIDNMFPCIFLIPGGLELEKLELVHNFLKDMGLQDGEMSVLFRLPSETHKDFNDYIKNNLLNSQLTEKTKVIFLSSKLPKTVLKFNRKFNLIVNLGYGSVHYTMKNFIKNHENVINYAVKTNQESLDFGDL